MMKNITLIKNKNKQGFSLLELLLVFAVSVALIASAFVIYSRIKTSQRADIESKNILIIKAGIKDLFKSPLNSNADGSLTDIAVSAKVFPASMLQNGRPKNLFDGVVKIQNMGEYFAIVYRQVPISECIKIITAVDNSFEHITVNLNSVKDSDDGLHVTNLSKQCNSDSSGLGNTIYLYFK
ncbi:type IV pilin [Salmonella enterica]|nr:type IV pilin [Salmonella enterica]EAX6579791.1 type IV pilin [Salmonella enterica]